MRQFFSMLVLGSAILLTACQSAPAAVSGQEVQVAGGVYRNVTADELDTLLGKTRISSWSTCTSHLSGTSPERICPFRMT